MTNDPVWISRCHIKNFDHFKKKVFAIIAMRGSTSMRMILENVFSKFSVEPGFAIANNQEAPAVAGALGTWEDEEQKKPFLLCKKHFPCTTYSGLK